MTKRIFFWVTAALAALAVGSPAQTNPYTTFGPLNVPGTSVIFDSDNVLTASQLAALTGTSVNSLVATPAVLASTFKAGPGQIFAFSASGLIGCCGTANTGPDGGGSSNIASLGSISGFVAPAGIPLVGVFTNGSPRGPAPPAYNYSGGVGQSTFSPVLNQVFFIGDGLTGTGSGSRQTFYVPSNATQLWLGFTDAGYEAGPPADYGDNVGSLSVTGTLAIAGTAPVLSSIGPVLPQQTQPITIAGSGFGTQAPYTGDSPYIEVTDVTNGPWNAGFGGDYVTLAVSSWTDSQIVLQGFQGPYGSNGWTIQKGDKLEVQIWNPLTGAGPTVCTLTVGQSGSQSCGPAVATGGIVPVFSSSSSIQPGSWVSVYGSNFTGATTVWNGDFPKSLGGVSVSFDGKPAYLWLVSPTQINLQVPDDASTGPVNVVVTSATGSSTSTITLAQFSPSFSLLDSRYAAAVVVTPGAPGNSGAGYDIVGPAGHFAYTTRPAKAGETVLLYGVGFGPTNPAVPAGALFSGAAQSVVLPQVTIGGVPATVTFAGIVESGLFQFNVVVPSAGSGDKLLQATVGGVATQKNVFITLQ